MVIIKKKDGRCGVLSWISSGSNKVLSYFLSYVKYYIKSLIDVYYHSLLQLAVAGGNNWKKAVTIFAENAKLVDRSFMQKLYLTKACFLDLVTDEQGRATLFVYCPAALQKGFQAQIDI